MGECFLTALEVRGFIGVADPGMIYDYPAPQEAMVLVVMRQLFPEFWRHIYRRTQTCLRRGWLSVRRSPPRAVAEPVRPQLSAGRHKTIRSRSRRFPLTGYAAKCAQMHDLMFDARATASQASVRSLSMSMRMHASDRVGRSDQGSPRNSDAALTVETARHPQLAFVRIMGLTW